MTEYKIVKSTVRDIWKIKVITTWFGFTVWSSYNGIIMGANDTRLDLIYGSLEKAEEALNAIEKDKAEKFV